MSAERSTESIIDLLYGELSEDEATQMREDLGDSAELEEFTSLLGRVREVMPVENVSPSLHASIMDAARAGVQHSEDDRITRRPAAEQGFWKRVGRGQGSQLALVAAVLIAGLFVVKAVDRGSSPLNAPASDISAMREAAPQMAAAPAAEQVAEQEVAADEAAFGDGEAAQAAATPAMDPAEGGEAIADQWSEKSAEPPTPPADIADSLRKELEASKGAGSAKSVAAPSPKPTTSTRAKSAKKRPSAPRKDAPAPSQNKMDSAEDDLLFGSLDRDDSDNIADGRVSTSSSSISGKAGLDSAPAAAEPMPVAEAEQKEEKPAEYRAQAGTLGEVNAYFRAGDYAGTIRAADEFAKNNPKASQADKASALFLKAQSLEKAGQYGAADRVYQSMQKSYPGYMSAEVDQARKGIQLKNVKKPAPKSKRKVDMKSADESYSPSSLD